MAISSDKNIVRNLRIRYMVLVDWALIWLALVLAVEMRLENPGQSLDYLRHAWPLLILTPLVRLPLYFRLNLYNRLWRYAGIEDLRSMVKAGLLAPLIIGSLNYGLLPLLNLPHSPSRSIWLLEGMLSLILLMGTRLSLRMYAEWRQRRHNTPSGTPNRERTLIVGAGNAGAAILREILQDQRTGMEVVGFIDDDRHKQGSSLMGIAILGDRTTIPHWVTELGVRQIILAIPTASGQDIRAIAEISEAAGLRPRIMPSLASLINGKVKLNRLRPIEIGDLLRREPIDINLDAVRKLLAGKRVMVTGGGGSIGSELCRQVLRCNPQELIILGHGENSIFEIENELLFLSRQQGYTTKISAYIADIRMRRRINQVVALHRPQIIFHAAAHKHVSLMENNLDEAITNNILGTKCMLDAAQAHNVEHFVLISTDKAVHPTSIMGVSKRAAEMLVLEAARTSGKCYVAVRFGNVLGSRGSVVLTFKRQIATGGPVTVTDPRVTRFFMTIPEAVQLVLQSATLGKGGEIFMLDMGEPVRIEDLAKDIIRLSGLRVDEDIEIVYTGLRPGEKLHEELMIEGEHYEPTTHPKCRIARNSHQLIPAELSQHLKCLEAALAAQDTAHMLRCLQDLVPEFHPAHDMVVQEEAALAVATPSNQSMTLPGAATKVAAAKESPYQTQVH